MRANKRPTDSEIVKELEKVFPEWRQTKNHEVDTAPGSGVHIEPVFIATKSAAVFRKRLEILEMENPDSEFFHTGTIYIIIKRSPKSPL